MGATTASAGSGSTSASAWAPLRAGSFRALWLAALVGLTGVWFPTVVGVAARLPCARIDPRLARAGGDALPYVLFGLVAGVLADTLDRRLILITTQATVAALGAVLAALSVAHLMPPALLLLLVFLLRHGRGARNARIPVARSRPRLAGRDTRRRGAQLDQHQRRARARPGDRRRARRDRWCRNDVHGRRGVRPLLRGRGRALAPGEHRTTAARALRPRSQGRLALRRNAPVVRRILLRAALFLVPASSLFALLPPDRLAEARGTGGYGLLLAELGLGAIAGALLLPRVRTRLSTNTLVTLASGFYALVLGAVALLHDAVAVLLLLIPAGVAWVVVLSTLNASLQLFLPAWVRGRSLATYTIVLFGSQALGALVFEQALADLLGLVQALLIAAGSAAVAAASIRILPFLQTSGMNRSTVVYWPEPQLASNVDPDGRTITVTVSYRVPMANQRPFVEAMEQGARFTAPNRRRLLWGLYRDGERDDTFVELFVVASWEEHLRQHHERLTGTDRAYQQRATALCEGEPVVAHLIDVDVPPHTET